MDAYAGIATFSQALFAVYFESCAADLLVCQAFAMLASFLQLRSRVQPASHTARLRLDICYSYRLPAAPSCTPQPAMPEIEAEAISRHTC